MAVNVLVRMGPYSAPGKVLTAVRDDDDSTDLRTVCIGPENEPEKAHDPVRVNGLFRCPVPTCGREERSFWPFPRGQERPEGGYKVLTTEQLAELGASKDEKETITLFSADRDKVDALALPDGKFYYVGLGKGTGSENYSLIRDVIKATPEKAYLAVWAYRTSARIVRVVLVGDVMGIQQIAWPAQVVEPPNVATPSYDQRFLPIALATADIIKVDFDPTTFVDVRKQKLTELLAGVGVSAAGAVSTPVQQDTGSTDALLAEMARWVAERGGSVVLGEQTPEKKPPRKRAPRKATTPRKKVTA